MDALETIGAALGTVGVLFGGAIVAWRKMSSNGTKGGAFAAKEHQWREDVLKELRALNGNMRDHMKDTEHNHALVMFRLQDIDKEITRP